MKKKYIGITFIFVLIVCCTLLYFYKKPKPINQNASPNNTLIIWDNDSISINGNGASKKNNTVTISSGGTYTLTGTSKDSNIIINADKGNVVLILSFLTLSSKSTAPIYIKKANLVTITIKEDTENYLTDNSTYQDTDKEEIKAVIHSKADLIINGSGTLTIGANYNNGITGKDTVTIQDSTLNINSTNDGIRAKDNLKIESATIQIEAKGNGVKSYNETDSNSGTMELLGSNITVNASQDGIEAITSLVIDGGTYQITSGGGSSNASTKNDWGFWGRNPSTQDTLEVASAKGLKADGTITIKNGTITINSSDDAIHSNDSITIFNGNLEIDSGDDGIHADNTLTIEDGTIDIKESYEGLEATNLYLKGGNVHIHSTDDGINASGGADGSSLNRKGANMFASDGSKVMISGGYYVIHSNGDGLDSNGDIEMTDGIMIIEGPTDDGNGAIDYNGTYNMKGGTLIATGSSGMAEAPSTSSTQNTMKVSFTRQNENSAIQIRDSNEKIVLTFSPTKNYSSLVYSSPELKQNEKYTIWLGGVASGENKDGVMENADYKNGEILTIITLTNSVTTFGNSGIFGGGGKMDMPPRR